MTKPLRLAAAGRRRAPARLRAGGAAMRPDDSTTPRGGITAVLCTRPGGNAWTAPAGPGLPNHQMRNGELPMIRVHTCVTVACAQCGDGPTGPGFEAYFPDESAALDAATAAGFVVSPDGRLLCSACGPVLVCEDEGHEFGPWRVLPGRPGREYRNCVRCCLHESHTTTPPPAAPAAAAVLGEVA